MKFSSYQMEIVVGNPEINRKKVREWVERTVVNEDPDTVVLPELWTTGFKLESLKELGDNAGETTKSFLSELAKEFTVNIIGGSVANVVDEKVYNTSYIYDSKGNLVYEYSKIHLVPMLDEHLFLTGGNEKVEIFELDGMKMGVIICYDLRFPELARSLALQGAQVMFITAQWPIERINHWRNIQLARAIENQMYVISSNSVGTHNGVQYGGTSMMTDPWGEIINEASIEKEETLTGNLDVERVIEVRREVPIFDSRVPKLY